MAEIAQDRPASREDSWEPDLKPAQEVTRESREETARAVETGDLGKAIEADTGGESPPNVIVRPEHEETTRRIDPPFSGESGQDL